MYNSIDHALEALVSMIAMLRSLIHNESSRIDDKMADLYTKIDEGNRTISGLNDQIEAYKNARPRSMRQMTPYEIDALFELATALSVNVGKKINAIKCVRALTGWGLKEAKDFVEIGPSSVGDDYRVEPEKKSDIPF